MADLKELQMMFPSAKEIKIVNKTFVVKPMVWTDFLAVLDDFGKIFEELTKKHPGFDLMEFKESDLGKITPVITEVLNIFARWIKTDVQWLKDHLTGLGTVQLLIDFLEVNEWESVKTLFFQLQSKVQTMNQVKK